MGSVRELKNIFTISAMDAAFHTCCKRVQHQVASREHRPENGGASGMTSEPRTRLDERGFGNAGSIEYSIAAAADIAGLTSLSE